MEVTISGFQSSSGSPSPLWFPFSLPNPTIHYCCNMFFLPNSQISIHPLAQLCQLTLPAGPLGIGQCHTHSLMQHTMLSLGPHSSARIWCIALSPPLYSAINAVYCCNKCYLVTPNLCSPGCRTHLLHEANSQLEHSNGTVSHVSLSMHT